MRRHRSFELEEKFADMKTRLTVAFKALRVEGVLAKQNFLCCGGCASNALALTIKDRAEKGKTYTGVVFYHQQDNASLKDTGEVCLRYSVAQYWDGTKDVQFGRPTEEVGKALCAALTAAGVNYTWNGNPSEVIKAYVI